MRRFSDLVSQGTCRSSKVLFTDVSSILNLYQRGYIIENCFGLKNKKSFLGIIKI